MNSNLSTYDPVSARGSELHREMRQVIGSLFNREQSDNSNFVTSQWVPAVDIKEEERQFFILADIPGVDPKAIEITMEKGILTIKGQRIDESIRQGGKLARGERSRGTFYRRFALPDSADPDGIKASGRHGVLEIVIPKRPETAPRRIHVE